MCSCSVRRDWAEIKLQRAEQQPVVARCAFLEGYRCCCLGIVDRCAGSVKDCRMAPPSFDIPHRASAVSKLTLKLFLFIVRLSVAPIPLPPPPPPCLLSRQPVTASTLPLETTMDTRADFDAMLPASRCPVLRNFLVLPLPLPPPVLLSFCCALLSLCACSSVGRSVTACSLLLSRFLLCDVLSSLGYGCTGLAVALELLRGWSVF